jgi:hypothetical protein
MSLVSAGIGSLAGSFLVGEVYRATVRAGVEFGWLWFWGILAGMITLIAVGFQIFYKGAAAAEEIPAGGAAIPVETR